MDLEHSSFLAAATPNEALGNMADAGVDELDISNRLSSPSLKKKATTVNELLILHSN